MAEEPGTIDKQRDNKGRFLPGDRFGFRPGQSGNAKGRPPKEFSITSLAKAALEADPTLVERIVLKWLEQAEQGKTEARRDLQDRLEGKVSQTHKQGGEITIRVEYDDSN